MTVEQDWTPQKRDFLQSTGHVLAMGGPGSGKTHVALVKARDEIRSAKLLSGQRILFLSFARPTVARVLEKAKELITADDLRLLDVNTYHGFAWSVLRSHGYLLSNGKPLQLLPPPEGSARLAHFAKEQHHQEKLRLFHEEGLLHFDLFAQLTAELLRRAGGWQVSTQRPTRYSSWTSSRTRTPTNGRRSASLDAAAGSLPWPTPTSVFTNSAAPILSGSRNSWTSSTPCQSSLKGRIIAVPEPTSQRTVQTCSPGKTRAPSMPMCRWSSTACTTEGVRISMRRPSSSRQSSDFARSRPGPSQCSSHPRPSCFKCPTTSPRSPMACPTFATRWRWTRNPRRLRQTSSPR